MHNNHRTDLEGGEGERERGVVLYQQISEEIITFVSFSNFLGRIKKQFSGRFFLKTITGAHLFHGVYSMHLLYM